MEKSVLAKVGDVEITKDQMIGILKNIPEEHAQSVAGEEGRARLLDEMIAGELLSLDAISKDMDKEEGFVEVVEEAKKGLLQRYAVNKLFETIQVTQEEAKGFYDENSTQFMEQEKVSAKHILVETEDKANIAKEEIANGKTFEEAATEYSTCPSKERGGDLGAFAKGQMVPEFEEAAFNAPIDELVGPIKTQFGFHLIKVSEITPAKVQAFEAVVDSIKNNLAGAKQQQIYLDKVAELKVVYPVTINEDELK